MMLRSIRVFLERAQSPVRNAHARCLAAAPSSPDRSAQRYSLRRCVIVPTRPLTLPATRVDLMGCSSSAPADSERIQRDDKARTYFQGLLTMRKWTSMKHLEVQSSKGEVSLAQKRQRRRSNGDLMPDVFFVPLSDLEAYGSFPRRGSNDGFVHNLTGLGNANLHRHSDCFDASTTAFVFVSHRWLRPGDAATGHPDDAENSKFAVLLAALQALRRGPSSPIPHDFEIAVWLDFACIDQDVAPGKELCGTLDGLLRMSDLVLTPVVDRDHATWQYPTEVDPAGWFHAYRSEQWQEYWRRAWCRVEAMLGAAYPVNDCERRAACFRGGLHTALHAKRRPHLLYGSKELAEGRAPIFLPPLLHGTFESYRPTDGQLTKPQQDMPTIRALEHRARARWPAIQTGFDAGYPYQGGDGHGRGRFVRADGSVVEGEWKDGELVHGRSTEADGSVYEGEWHGGARHGRGCIWFASGASYEGEWRAGKPHGVGRDVWADGGVYEGQFADGMRHGHGKHVFANGDSYEGEWRYRRKHGRGKEVRGVPRKPGGGVGGAAGDASDEGAVEMVVIEGEWRDGVAVE